MLHGACILVCEDEPFIALDLALCIEDAGGQVVGPAASIAEARALLATTAVSGAILDVHLSDGEVTPIAVQLLEGGVPVVVQTGVGLPSDLKARYPALPVHTKPVFPQHLIAKLASQIAPA